MIRGLRIVIGVFALTTTVALAERADDLAVRNWAAPPTWSPSAAPEGAVAGDARQRLGREAGRTAELLPASGVSAPYFFVAVTPCRVADTRAAFGFTGEFGPPFMPGGTPRDFPIAGQCGIPTTAAAVSFNFTVTNTAGAGFLLAFGAGASAPNVSTLNYGAAGQTVANAAVVALGAAGAITTIPGVSGFDLIIDVNGYYALSGERNPVPDSAGSPFTIQAGGASVGATDKAGGAMLLAGGVGTGLGGGGNLHLQTSPADAASDTTDNITVDRRIIVAKAKPMTLSSPGFTSILSIHLTGTNTAGGRIFYTIRATDGGTQIATEQGVLQYLATANSITCTVQTTDKLHLGTVNSGCTPGFFNPGSQPGVSIFDNVTFSSPAPIVVHEVYFSILNESGSTIRLEP